MSIQTGSAAFSKLPAERLVLEAPDMAPERAASPLGYLEMMPLTSVM